MPGRAEDVPVMTGATVSLPPVTFASLPPDRPRVLRAA